MSRKNALLSVTWLSMLLLLAIAIPAFAVAPVISSFMPDNGKAGDVISITGSGLTGATSAKVNGVVASFSVLSVTSMTVTIPNGATTGAIAVTTPGGTASSATNISVWVPSELDITLDLGSGFIGVGGSSSLSYSLTGTASYAGTINVANGSATITGIKPGGYALSLYGSHWLRRTISGIDLTSTKGVATVLANGDADGNNLVNLFDFVFLDSFFGSSNVMADLDGNGQVNLFDYVIIDSYFDAKGDVDGNLKTNPVDGAEMVWVSAGSFLRGSGNDYSPDERPQSSINLDGYYVYKNAVTVAQYRAFCQATSRSMPTTPVWGWQDSHPIVNITWQEAHDYAAWAGVSLPTEAQWEKAARGTDGRLYPWGNTWIASACVNYNNSDTTKPVGSYPTGISLYGCLDMAGNVWEWCSDWYDAAYYLTSPVKNPGGATSGTYRVIRGGSWFNGYSGDFRTACRNYALPTRRSDTYGFRCVMN